MDYGTSNPTLPPDTVPVPRAAWEGARRVLAGYSLLDERTAKDDPNATVRLCWVWELVAALRAVVGERKEEG